MVNNVVREILAHHKNGNLISILKEVQDNRIDLSKDVMMDIAKSVGVSFSDVYEIASFYSFLSTEPIGKNVIRICKSIPCFMKSCDVVIKAIEKELGIKPGEITADKKFSFHLTNCIGACDIAPAMMINKKRYGNLTPGKIAQILDEYK
ncbi:TPA: NADH-quinone oxidoreductase subunit NuoE [Candidatus Poribacteria bacterium]|nr:NADH-quinone oxidoreductase subunit NuoE [Candidatus Poribacteria bacterium]